MLVPLEKPSRDIDFAEGIDINAFKRDIQTGIKQMKEGHLDFLQQANKYQMKLINSKAMKPYTDLMYEVVAAMNKAESMANYFLGNATEIIKRDK